MTQQHEIQIDARKLELRDLDFPEYAERLKNHIEKLAAPSVDLIKLDLRWCVVIYSSAHVFLDSCLSTLAQNQSKTKLLTILTTDNYITRELTCYELFRTTLAVTHDNHNPKSATDSLDRYCSINKLHIRVEIFSGDQTNPDAKPINCYMFPLVETL